METDLVCNTTIEGCGKVRVKQRTKIFCDMCGKEIPPEEEKQISSVSIEKKNSM